MKALPLALIAGGLIVLVWILARRSAAAPPMAGSPSAAQYVALLNHADNLQRMMDSMAPNDPARSSVDSEVRALRLQLSYMKTL